MRTGVRLTALKNGDSLLGEVWNYKDLSGVEAVQQKLEDLFLYISKLNFTEVIDSIPIAKDNYNQLYIANSGINGELWPFVERLKTYKDLCQHYKLNLFLEIDFPTVVTQQNYMAYAQFTANIINNYSWVKYWQICTEPDSLDSAGKIKCPAHLYVKILKYVKEVISIKYPDIQIGGPGCSHGIANYVKSAYQTPDNDTYHLGWLAEAIGEYYGTNQYTDVDEPAGFLSYIDFFAFQGRQDFEDLKYESYPEIIKNLKDGINTQLRRNNLSKQFIYYSTYQGHQAEQGNFSDLQTQAFRDLREIINAYSCDVIPFKTQLVDEFYNEDSDLEKNCYGLLYYFLGNTKKPAYDQFNFILNKIEQYTQLADNTYHLANKRPYVISDDVTSIMLMNSDKSLLGTIIFPTKERQVLVKNPVYTKVTLKPAANRYYYLPDKTNGMLLNPLDIVFKTYDFIFVEEEVSLDAKVDDSVYAEAEKRMQIYRNYARVLLDDVPNDYPKETYDGLNYPKFLRALAMELGDLEYERTILEDNYYLKTAHGDMIYNNFGCMIQVEQRRDWDEEKYRSVVSAIIESLLHGATKPSIEKALMTCTGFTVHIYEMYKDYERYGMTEDMSFENQYRFYVDVEKSFDASGDLDLLIKDIHLVIDITKPAHTIPIIIISYVGEEDYQSQYETIHGEEWKNSDKNEVIVYDFEESNQYGWKSLQYPLVFHPNVHNLNSAYVLGPKYTLHDRDNYISVINHKEYYQTPHELDEFDVYANYNEVYEKTPEEFDLLNIEMLLIEQRFGYRNYKDRVLRTGLTTNNFVTGFKYMLSDDCTFELSMTLSDDVPKPLDELLLTVELYHQDNYEPKSDDYLFNSQLSFSELPYRIKLDKVLKTGLKTNSYKTGFVEKMDDVLEINTDFILKEQFPKPKIESKTSLDIIHQEQFPKPEEFNLISQSMPIIEAPYNFVEKPSMLITNHSITNQSTTCFPIKMHDACSIKVYEIIDGVEVLVNEEDF